MKKLALAIINLLFFTFYACSSTAPILRVSRFHYTSPYSTDLLASHEDSLIQSHTNSLLSKGFVKKLKPQKVIAISDIENATGEKIDIDSLMTRFKNALSDEEKFVFSRAIAGSGSKIDTLLKILVISAIMRSLTNIPLKKRANCSLLITPSQGK